MAEENEEVTGEAVAADAAGQQETGEDSTGAADQGQDEVAGLKAGIEAERKKRQDAEGQLQQQSAYYQQMMQLTQANAQQPQAGAQQLDESGLFEDEEYVSGKQVKDLLDNNTQQILQGVQQQNFATQHPDYPEVVGSINLTTGQFSPSQHLQNVFKRNPQLQFALQKNPMAHVLAYELANNEKDRAERQVQVAASKEHAAQQQASQSTAPISPAAIAGGGAMAQAGQVGQLDDEAFNKLDKEVMSGKHG